MRLEEHSNKAMAHDFLTLSQALGKPTFHPSASLDARAERLILDHLQSRRQDIDKFPITASDLTTLIEDLVEDLDLYADLSEFGESVEGATFFQPGKRPIVKITQELSENKNDNRLKSTLAHELGHVVLHDPEFQRKQQAGLFSLAQSLVQVSFRDAAFQPKGSCQYEHQAWYFCGATLMPRSEVLSLLREFLSRDNSFSTIWKDSDLGREIIELVAKRFAVSTQLARIHLVRTKAISDTEPPPSLF